MNNHLDFTKSLIPGLQKTARAITGQEEVQVILSEKSCTDGKTIEICPMFPHELLEKGGEGIFRTMAILLYHELGHVLWSNLEEFNRAVKEKRNSHYRWLFNIAEDLFVDTRLEEIFPGAYHGLLKYYLALEREKPCPQDEDSQILIAIYQEGLGILDFSGREKYSPRVVRDAKEIMSSFQSPGTWEPPLTDIVDRIFQELLNRGYFEENQSSSDEDNQSPSNEDNQSSSSESQENGGGDNEENEERPQKDLPSEVKNHLLPRGEERPGDILQLEMKKENTVGIRVKSMEWTDSRNYRVGFWETIPPPEEEIPEGEERDLMVIYGKQIGWIKNKLQTQMIFNSRRRYYAKTSGSKINAKNLARVATSDVPPKVFLQKSKRDYRDYAVVICFDLSFSMEDYVYVPKRGEGIMTRINLCREAVWVAQKAFSSIGAKTKIVGFNGKKIIINDYHDMVNISIIKDFHENFGVTAKKRLFCVQAMSDTPLGGAVAYCVTQLIPRPETDKFAVVITDGESTSADKEFTRKTLAIASRHDIAVYGIGIDLDPDYHQDMAGYFPAGYSEVEGDGIADALLEILRIRYLRD